LPWGQFEHDKAIKNMAWAHLFGLLWNLAFLVAAE